MIPGVALDQASTVREQAEAAVDGYLQALEDGGAAEWALRRGVVRGLNARPMSRRISVSSLEAAIASAGLGVLRDEPLADSFERALVLYRRRAAGVAS